MNDIAYYVDSINFCRREKFASVQCSFPLKGQYHYLLQYSQTSVLYLQLAVVVCGGRAEIIILFLSPVIPPTPSLPPAAHQEAGGGGSSIGPGFKAMHVSEMYFMTERGMFNCLHFWYCLFSDKKYFLK